MVGRLLLRFMILAAIVIGAIAAIAEARAWWTTGLAIAALLIAVGIAAIAVQELLAYSSDVEPESPARGIVVTMAAVAAVGVVLAIALSVGNSAATANATPTAATAARTVRDFLATAVLDDNTYHACQYLTPAAQQRVAQLAGNGQTCRDAFTSTQPSFPGVHSEGSLHALALHAVVRGGAAYVTATPRRARPVTFILRPTTAAEADAFQAPSAAWRIASGATAVLGA